LVDAVEDAVEEGEEALLPHPTAMVAPDRQTARRREREI
jgi:hypothetical protein